MYTVEGKYLATSNPWLGCDLAWRSYAVWRFRPCVYRAFYVKREGFVYTDVKTKVARPCKFGVKLTLLFAMKSRKQSTMKILHGVKSTESVLIDPDLWCAFAGVEEMKVTERFGKTCPRVLQNGGGARWFNNLFLLLPPYRVLKSEIEDPRKPISPLSLFL